ncbi:MAG TPA: IclR family transcriptional regulator [Xanthobacteraceae bacterium]|jgi:DNA-binding IclR family transcriptional regulator|nr:IclR family transcriptional regulator [Xanthobacteraceae bacterium]
MPAQLTPSTSERALILLELIAHADEPPTLNELIRNGELPKATTHRFLSLLERLGFVHRTLDGKRYAVGQRLTSLSIQAIRHSVQSAPRRAIMTALVNDVGETCNLTILDGLRLAYLDRVESDWPLQYRLNIGSHVPLHCTASGKLFLSLSPVSLRKSLYETGSLKKHTRYTITSPAALEKALAKIQKTEIGTDNEEFIEGMTAAAVPVYDGKGRICATVAVHGPASRLPFKTALALAPRLKKAASAIEQTFINSEPRPAATSARAARR